MLITTTPGIEGRPVTEYLGIVTAQGVLGVNAFKDVSAGVRNIFGGRAKSYENELASGVSDALAEMEKQAAQLGADAVVGCATGVSKREGPADSVRFFTLRCQRYLSADQPDLRVELRTLAGRHVCFTQRVFADGLAVSRTEARRTRGRSPDRPAGAAAGQCFRRGGIRVGNRCLRSDGGWRAVLLA